MLAAGGRAGKLLGFVVMTGARVTGVQALMVTASPRARKVSGFAVAAGGRAGKLLGFAVVSGARGTSVQAFAITAKARATKVSGFAVTAGGRAGKLLGFVVVTGARVTSVQAFAITAKARATKVSGFAVAARASRHHGNSSGIEGHGFSDVPVPVDHLGLYVVVAIPSADTRPFAPPTASKQTAATTHRCTGIRIPNY